MPLCYNCIFGKLKQEDCLRIEEKVSLFMDEQLHGQPTQAQPPITPQLEIIEGEDKDKPYSDDKLETILNEKGYNIARRTVAKYREQLNIPVARLRKEL